MSARNDKVFQGNLAIVGGNNIHYIIAGKCRRHARTVVYKGVDSVRGLTAADVRGSAVVSVVKSVRQSEFTKDAGIRCRRERLVGARVETYPAISTKQEWASHCFIGDDVYPYRK